MEFDDTTKHVIIRNMTIDKIEQVVRHLQARRGYDFEIGSTGEDGGTLVYCNDVAAATLLRFGARLRD